MFRTPFCASSFRRFSISRVALRSTFEAIFGSVTTGAIRCGIPSYKFNSRRLGSTSTIFTSSGVALYKIDISSELMKTLLPVPVEPAISRCGMLAKSVTRIRPCKSRPIASVNLLAEPTNSCASMISRSAIVCRFTFGTSMPIVDFPGIRSIVLDSRFRLELKRGHYRAWIDLRHAPLYIEFQALFFNRPRAVLQFLFVQLLRTFPFAQQIDRRQFVICIGLGDFRVGRFLRGFFRFLLIQKEDGRFVRCAFFFVFLIYLGFATKNIAFIRQLDGLLRFIECRSFAYWLPAFQTIGLYSPPHPFLLATGLPVMPSGLRLLQDSQLSYRSHRTARAGHPCV